MQSFLNFLEKRLKAPLPGPAAQKIMAPVPERDKHPEVSIPIDAFRNAVLILFSQSHNSRLEILYTLRSHRLLHHKGQISFPGGRRETNETPVETALRETYEEVGIEPERISVLGSLSPLYVPPSNNVIDPVTGYIDKIPRLKIQETEVSEAFTISLEELYSGASKQRESWLLRGKKYAVPYWNVHSTPLWGATAMITSEIMELYKEYLQKQ
ncbi:MAG: CoA pyrophosphatase [Balneolales bacterium]